jgi:hypothetical protein
MHVHTRTRTARRVVAGLAAVALLATGTAAATEPGGRKGTPPPPTQERAVAVGQLVATLTDVRCNGHDGQSLPGASTVLPDGNFIERRAHAEGKLVSADRRLSGDLVLDIAGVYDSAVGTFDGTWELQTATGTATGTAVATVENLLVRGWLEGTLEDGSRLVGNYTATPHVVRTKVAYTFEIGTPSAFPATAFVQSGSCAPYTSQPAPALPAPLG